MLASPTLPVILGAMAFQGLLNGPMDVAMFTLRQRQTDPAWMGRAFAVSMSLNFLGYPVGAAIGGVLVVVEHGGGPGGRGRVHGAGRGLRLVPAAAAGARGTARPPRGRRPQRATGRRKVPSASRSKRRTSRTDAGSIGP